ncbi:MAG TPA: HAD family hydrolase [Chloroflexota bacterium]|nr:HAD family hydrolase [Chloroflexota bacterium]
MSPPTSPNDLLPSWNDTATRQAIVAFVAAATTAGGPGFVLPAERVAVFDNDGTLWCEKPLPIQLDYTLRRMASMAAADPALRERQPWKAAYEHDLHWLGAAMVKHYQGDDGDLHLLVEAVPQAFAGLSVGDFDADVRAFFAAATHPTLKRPYLACAYKPMIELLRYLEAGGFATYIASGGDRDFMRAVAGDLYGIPPERVIGSSLALEYQENDAGTDVLYKGRMEFFDDGPTKPVRIWSRLGRRPVVAGGNSNGDVPMLRFSRSPAAPGGAETAGAPAAPTRPALRLLLLHDDAEREFAYTAGAEAALERAGAQGWTVISIKTDWATVFVDPPA